MSNKAEKKIKVFSDDFSKKRKKDLYGIDMRTDGRFYF